MDGDRSSQDKYTLPVEFEELLDQRNFTYVSISGGVSGEFDKFVIWLAKPVTEVRARAEAFIRRLYGRDLLYHLFPRTYVREARELARLGMHEDAPLEVSRQVLRRYKELWDTYQRHAEGQRIREQARQNLERANPKIAETGTYIGPVKGASLCVWRDRFGYTHAAPAWMQNLAPGQKFIDGKVVDLPQGIGELTPIIGVKATPDDTNILSKHGVGDAREVPGVEASRPRTLVLSWQGEWVISTPRRVHQEGDPLMEVVEFDSEGIPHVVGACAASLFHSKVTGRDILEDLLLAWGVVADALSDVRDWLESRIASHSSKALFRTWPLSRMAMPRWAELADMGERRVTLYAETDLGLGRSRIEATHLQVTRGNYAQYSDAFFVRFKPRSKMLLWQITETSHPALVALLGWEHPDLQELRVEEGYAIGYAIKKSKYISADARWEHEFDAALRFYIETHPLVRVVLDLRGETVHTRSINLSDAVSASTSMPPELGRPVVVPFALPAPQIEEPAVPPKRFLFVSYHHARDAAYRVRFEQDFHELFESVSIYPGEINTKASELSVKHDIRTRIKECECLIVLIGATTYTRKWVDYEIRTALDSTLPGGPRPVVGLLTPELSPAAAEIRAEIDIARSRGKRQNYTTRNVHEISETLSAEMRAKRGFTLPARLVDNLLAGQGMLAAWPEDIHRLEALIAQGRSVIGRPLNSRKLMRTDES